MEEVSLNPEFNLTTDNRYAINQGESWMDLILWI